MRLKLGGGSAHALRAIGQDLQIISPESFEVRLAGKDFIVRGYSRLQVSAPERTDDRSSFGKIWRKLSRLHSKALHTPCPALMKFERVYSPNDIKRLDEWQTSRRIDAAKRDQARKPDLHSLQERLRMIGRILDDKFCELVRLSQDVTVISVEYRDGEGKIYREEYSTVVLYDLQRQYYLERDLSAGDPWQRIRAHG